MKAVLVLVVVSSCVCGMKIHRHPKPAQAVQHTSPAPNTTAENMHNVALERILMSKPKDKSLRCSQRSGDLKRERSRGERQAPWVSHLSHRNTTARIIELHKRHPNGGSLKRLPRLDVRETASPKPSLANLTYACDFACPDAKSLQPCACDPCTRSINCSTVTTFAQLYQIFHTTTFPDPRFESFEQIPPLRQWATLAIRSDPFLANTFGVASFVNIKVEGTWVTEVQPGAFSSSEETLKSLSFRWNPGLTIFPFSEVGVLPALDTLEVTGSIIATLPVFPHTPSLARLFLNGNKITSIPQRAFAELPNIQYLDVAYNSLQTLGEDSMSISAENAVVYVDHNTISSIHKNAFSNLQPIQFDISDNSLTTLDQDIFEPILRYIMSTSYDGYINAYSNPLCCDNLSWLLDNSLYLTYVFMPEPPCTW